MAPRSIWTGSISFGLVNVPIKLYTAVRPKDIHFTQLDPKGNRVHNKRVSEKTGREVDYDDIKKGYEVSRGTYVVVDPADLEAAKPEATRTIEITDFVDLADIDPIYYEKTYYAGPATKEKGAAKAYGLLVAAMEAKEMAAIGSFVMRAKQYLAAIRPREGVLALSTLYFADEVVDAGDVPDAPVRRGQVSDREIDMAGQIVESLASPWKPERYHDSYREEVLEIIEKKAKGEEIVTAPEAEPEAKVVDLMAALEASLDAVQKGGKKARTKKRRKSA